MCTTCRVEEQQMFLVKFPFWTQETVYILQPEAWLMLTTDIVKLTLFTCSSASTLLYKFKYIFFLFNCIFSSQVLPSSENPIFTISSCMKGASNVMMLNRKLSLSTQSTRAETDSVRRLLHHLKSTMSFGCIHWPQKVEGSFGKNCYSVQAYYR